MCDFIHEVHQWLSAELDLVIDQVDAIVATANAVTPMGLPPRTLLDQMLERCVIFCGALARHHMGEDFGAFPMVAQAFPALAQLRAEHLVVAEINTLIRELLQCYTPGTSD